MTPLVLTCTKTGLARIAAAQLGEPVDLRIATVGLSDAAFVAAPTLEALPGEFRRLDTISGREVGDNVIHMIVRDDEAIAYKVRGFGLFLPDGTLFASYAQGERMVEKSAASSLNVALDLTFMQGLAASLTFGDANFLNPPATTTTRGVVELATDAECDAGTGGLLVVTARQLKRAADAVATAIGETFAAYKQTLGEELAAFKQGVTEALTTFGGRKIEGDGLVTGGGDLSEDRTLKVTAATPAQIRAGTSTTTASTPAGLAEAGAVFVVAQELTGGGAGYRVWSDGVKECWGSIGVPANSTVTVVLPTAHDTGCVPTGTCSIAQDEASIGALNASAAGFDVRSRNPLPTTFFWHTKGH